MKSKPNPTAFGMNRRWAMTLLLGVAGLLAGCKKAAVSSGNGEAATAGSGGLEARAAEGEVVTVYTWDQYLNPDLLTAFEKRSGIRVEVCIYESSDEMVEGLKSEPGKYDVVLSEDGYIPILAGKRMLRPLDHSKLGHWKNLTSSFTNQHFDPRNEFSSPYLWGTTLLAYRKDLLPSPKTSWSLMFDPALKGRVSLLDDMMECYAGALRTMGVDNLSEAGPEQISSAADALTNLVKENSARFGGLSGNEVKQHLLEGSSWVCMMYSGDAALIAEENPQVPIAYFIPEEGATIWIDSFCISRDTTRAGNAHAFIDFMLEAESAAASANFLRYASPNRAAREFIEADLLADETINPKPEVLAKCSFFNLKDVESKRMVNAGWRRVMNAWYERSGQASGKVAPGAEQEPGNTDSPAAPR